MSTNTSLQTVLVFGASETAVAVRTSITVRRTNHEGITFSGPVCFDEKSQKHIGEILLPIAQGILCELNCEQVGGFQVSISNLSAASLHDQGIIISGFSADAPLILALVSAGLGLKVQPDFICTGHVASPQGEIAMVSSLPAKLRVVLEEIPRGIFCHPSLSESSLQHLRPNETQELDLLVRQSRQQGLMVREVSHLGELFELAFTQAQRWIAGLKHGWIDSQPKGKLAQSLMPETNFTETIKSCFLKEEIETAIQFLSSYIDYHVRKKAYPENLGSDLQNVLHALPFSVCKKLRMIDLITSEDISRIEPFTKDDHQKDIKKLIEWKKYLRSLTNRITQTPGDTQQLVQEVLDEIHPHHLAESMIPVDNARAVFPLEDVRVNDSDVFWELLTAYYVHLLQSVGEVNAVENKKHFLASAMVLIDRAMGHLQALQEALEPKKGGMNYILNRVTEQFKQERVEQHVKAVLASKVDPLDFQQQLNFIKAFFMLKQDVLPRSILEKPPESFLGDWKKFIRAYVEHEAVLQERLLKR